jgi:hypothetical protein
MPLPYRRRRRVPRDAVAKLDLHDYAVRQPDRRCSAGRPAEPITVTDDWPEMVPVGDTELRVIEGHLREELDALFGPIE